MERLHAGKPCCRLQGRAGLPGADVVSRGVPSSGPVRGVSGPPRELSKDSGPKVGRVTGSETMRGVPGACIVTT